MNGLPNIQASMDFIITSTLEESKWFILLKKGTKASSANSNRVIRVMTHKYILSGINLSASSQVFGFQIGLSKMLKQTRSRERIKSVKSSEGIKKKKSVSLIKF